MPRTYATNRKIVQREVDLGVGAHDGRLLTLQMVTNLLVKLSKATNKRAPSPLPPIPPPRSPLLATGPQVNHQSHTQPARHLSIRYASFTPIAFQIYCLDGCMQCLRRIISRQGAVRDSDQALKVIVFFFNYSLTCMQKPNPNTGSCENPTQTLGPAKTQPKCWVLR